MKTLEEQREFFKGDSMKLIDLQITKAKSPMWNHQEEITTAATSSLNGMSRWIECTEHLSSWEWLAELTQEMETRQMEARPAGM